MRLLAGCLVVVLFCTLSACQERDAERASPSDADTSGGLALPPSAGAPRATLPGGAPDTLEPEGAEGRRFMPAELEVDSIVGVYHDEYLAEFYDRREAKPGALTPQLDPAVVEATERRTALQFGYVELNGWEQLLSDLAERQRAELTRRIDDFHRSLRAGAAGGETGGAGTGRAAESGAGPAEP